MNYFLLICQIQMKEIAYKSVVSGQNYINDEVIISNFENVVPLSKTNPERIDMIRCWGKERAVPASGNITMNTQTETRRKVLI